MLFSIPKCNSVKLSINGHDPNVLFIWIINRLSNADKHSIIQSINLLLVFYFLSWLVRSCLSLILSFNQQLFLSCVYSILIHSISWSYLLLVDVYCCIISIICRFVCLLQLILKQLFFFIFSCFQFFLFFLYEVVKFI